jgi:riboflavin synthase
LGRVKSFSRKRGLLGISVESGLFNGERAGNSVAVNGVCLTIARVKEDSADFDIMAETARKSNLGGLKKLEMVNLERALKIGDRLGGHMVSGHVDCVGKIIKITNQPENYFLTVGLQKKEDTRFLVRQGSAALNGVSLTVAELQADSFTVCLIPHTLENTNLRFKKIGDLLNVEFDLAGKYILNLVGNEKAAAPEITEAFLRGHGLAR